MIGTRKNRNFITRTGPNLYDGPHLFKFSATNCCGLGLDRVSSWIVTSDLIYPSHQQVDDWYSQAVSMGCQVVRAYSCMPTLGSPMTCFPTAGTPNEAAYRAIDYAIARAADYGLRLVIPLCDPYGYYVGCTYSPAHSLTGAAIGDWSTFYGGNGADFFTNSTVINGFLSAVGHHLNRVNTFTGIQYKNDPTIMCWETGNEILPPSSWTATVATYLKANAPRQLVMDGYFCGEVGAEGSTRGPDPNSLSTGSPVDLLDAHFYPNSVAELASLLATTNISNKALCILEYDWNSNRGGDSLPTWASAIVANRASLAGCGYWNLASHADGHGWSASANNYAGQDGLPYDTLLGSPINEAKILQLRQLAYDFRGVTAPAWPVPGVPQLKMIGSALAWRGAAGSSSYTIERSTTSATAGFTSIATNPTDFSTPWSDPAPPTSPKWYRVRGVTPDGCTSYPSNVVEL